MHPKVVKSKRGAFKVMLQALLTALQPINVCLVCLWYMVIAQAGL